MRCDLSLRTPTERKHDPDAINRAMARDCIGGATAYGKNGEPVDFVLIASFDGQTFFAWCPQTQQFCIPHFELPLKQ